jgi:hypothetical protein
MPNIKVLPSKIKNHVATHKAAYVAGAVAIAAIALQQRNQKDFNKFLDEKGLTEEYYFMSDTPEEN